MPSDPHVFDELALPFIFVPHGAPDPTDWLASHPDHIKLPATFVPHESGDGRQDRPSGGPPPGGPPPGQRAPVDGLGAPPDPTSPSVGDAISDRIPVAPNHVADPSFSSDDPIAAFLRADDALPSAAHDYASGSTSGSVTQATAKTEAPPEEQPLNPLEATPPVSAGTSAGPAGRASEAATGVPSLSDGDGGEWRYFPGDQSHDPHGDDNDRATPNPSRQNVPVERRPPVKPDLGE